MGGTQTSDIISMAYLLLPEMETYGGQSIGLKQVGSMSEITMVEFSPTHPLLLARALSRAATCPTCPNHWVPTTHSEFHIVQSNKKNKKILSLCADLWKFVLPSLQRSTVFRHVLVAKRNEKLKTRKYASSQSHLLKGEKARLLWKTPAERSCGWKTVRNMSNKNRKKYGWQGCCRTQIGVGKEHITVLDLQGHCTFLGQGHYL